MVTLALGMIYTFLFATESEPTARTYPTCKQCGGELSTVLITDAEDRIVFARGPPTSATA